MIWSIITSYSFIYRSEALAKKNTELAETQKKYAESNNQFQELKNDIQKSTKTLELRQVYLQQLMDSDKSLSNAAIADQTEAHQSRKNTDHKQKNKPLAFNDISPSIVSEFRNNAAHHKQLAALKFNLSRIEQQQQALAEIMIDRISNKITYVEKTLKKSGIKSRILLKLAGKNSLFSTDIEGGMGGPFILYSENNDMADLSENEPFAKLYAHYMKLVSLENAVQHIPIGMPVKKYYISSGFGIRKDPFKHKWARHNGVDMAGWYKTPIYAPADGIVTKAGPNGSYGNFIEINHGNGFFSRYGHLSKIKVKVGDHVTLEQKIALMGSTGRSTSTHLHYEILFNGHPINPQKIFKAYDNVLKIQRQEYDS